MPPAVIQIEVISEAEKDPGKTVQYCARVFVCPDEVLIGIFMRRF
jgi:hypothetical protein